MSKPPKPRTAVLRMAPYNPPTAGRLGKLRLDFNENTVGASPRVVSFLKAHLDGEGLSVYPEYGDVRGPLAGHFSVPPEELLLTNGTDEAIQVVINTYVNARQDVITLTPSYAMYRFYAEVAGARVHALPYREPDLAFPLEELLASVTPRTRAILIANPNNPTGTGIDVEGVERVLRKARRAAVLIDEAYYEFSGVTALPLLARHSNLFISRTFSKAYGMAALRIGCLFSQAGNVELLHKAQSPYSVNMVAAMAARAAIEDTAYVQNFVREVKASRDLLYQGFERLGIAYVRSQANFVLFRAGARATEIRDRLRAVGILVRDRSYEIEGGVRVTAGTQEQAQRFLAELEKIW